MIVESIALIKLKKLIEDYLYIVMTFTFISTHIIAGVSG